MNLFTARQAIVDKLREKLSKDMVRDVRHHRGQFDSLKELQDIALRKSSVLVAFTRFRDAKRVAGVTQANVDWVVYVVTQDQRRMPRDEVAATISNCLLDFIPNNLWGFAVKKAENLDGRNVTTHAIDKTKVAIWAITWSQLMPIAKCDDPTLYDWTLTEIDTDHDHDGEIEMAVKIDMNPAT